MMEQHLGVGWWSSLVCFKETQGLPAGAAMRCVVRGLLGAAAAGTTESFRKALRSKGHERLMRVVKVLTGVWLASHTAFHAGWMAWGRLCWPSAFPVLPVKHGEGGGHIASAVHDSC